MFRIAKTAASAAALSLLVSLVACTTVGSTNARKANDENEIVRTVSEYCRLLDQQRGRGLAQLFTEDATFTHHGSEPVRGNRAIEGTFGRGPARPQPRVHVASNPIIIVDGDRATGSIDHLLLERNEDGTFAIVLMGRWVDSYVRVADRWLIAERKIEFPYGEPSSRVKPPESH